jgi:uncharacterized membrane protein YbaN (DUF454 family)
MRRDDNDQTDDAKTAAATSGPRRWLWLGAGIVCVGLGIVGLILPVMPGTVFLIMAAACFARGSPRLEAWLLNHPQLGPSVVAWRRDGAIAPRAKLMAFAGMALSLVIVSVSGAPPIGIAASALLIGAGAAYVATRPSRAS